MRRNKTHRKTNKRVADIRERRDVRGQTCPRILIVCEGEKTEPYYFRGIRASFGLDSNDIVVVAGGISPANIVKLAEEEYNESERHGIPFDKVYCVFDKNSHADYRRALAQIANKENFEAIVSVPCFEYWLLLHYLNTTKPYKKKGNKSACDQVVSELAKRISDYRKGERGVFAYTEKKLATAITNAKIALASAQQAGTDNPSTTVHILIEHLQKLARARR